MTGAILKSARLNSKWTQEEAASKLGLTQAYLSMVERGHRPVTTALAARASEVFDLPPMALPLETEDSQTWNEDDLSADLGALGYPGFAYLRGKPKRNPAQLLFHSLNQSDLDARVVEALPWLASRYVELDWDWLMRNAKLTDRQNRLGFVVSVAAELANKSGDDECSKKLAEYQALMDRSRLVREDTLCHDSMTQAERKWLRQNRPPGAEHWNLLTDLDVRHLAYEFA
jgi:transcriptional regulator with XRE-family HTH domain